MKTFVEQLNTALDQRHTAARYARTQRFAAACRWHSEQGFGVTVAAFVGMGVFVFFTSAFVAALLNMHLVLIVGFVTGMGLMTVVPSVLYVWTEKAENLCLTLRGPRLEPTRIVETVRLCKNAGATEEQLLLLGVAAKDTTTPSNWWFWVEREANAQLALNTQRQAAHTQALRNIQAQRDIDAGALV